MSDKLPGINVSQEDIVSMLKSAMNIENTTKTVEVKTKGFKEGAKEISGFNKALSDLSKSKNGTQYLDKYNQILDLMSGKFKNIKLNTFATDLLRATSDPNNAAKELAATIDRVYESLQALSSISNSGKFEFIKENEIRSLIELQQTINSLKADYNSTYEKAKTEAQSKYAATAVQVPSVARLKGIGKTRHTAVAEQLGLGTSQIELGRRDDELLSSYKQTADLLAKMIEERKEFNNLNKQNVGDYVKQEGDILSVFRQLQSMEAEIGKRFNGDNFKIDPSKLLSSQFKNVGFENNFNQALNAYAKQMSAGISNELEKVKQKLNNKISSATDKAAVRVDKEQQRVGKSKGNVGETNADSSAATGAAVGEGVASGMQKAEDATESAKNEIREYIKTVEDSIEEINRLQDVMEKGGLSASEENKIRQKQAYYMANIRRQNATKDQIETINKDALSNAENGTNLIKQGDFGEAGKKMLSDIQNFTDSMQSIIDRWTQHNRSHLSDSKPEQFMIANDETGFVVEGKNKTIGGIPKSVFQETNFNAKGQGNSSVHSHPDEQIAAFSFDDIYAAIEQKAKGIIHQYVVSLNDISMLDVSKFTNEQLSQIAETLKETAYEQPPGTKEFYIKEEAAFDLVKDSLNQYIDDAISDLQSFLGKDSDKIDYSDLKARIQNQIKEEAITGYEEFSYVLSEQMAEALATNKIDFDESKLDDQVVNPQISKIQQAFVEKMLLESIKQVTPDLDISSVYKRTSLSDYNKGESLLPGVASETTKAEVPVDTSDASEKIRQLEEQVNSLKESLQQFQELGIEPQGISELQQKLEEAERTVQQLNDRLLEMQEGSVDVSEYDRLETELEDSKANAISLKEELERVNAELEKQKSEQPIETSKTTAEQPNPELATPPSEATDSSEIEQIAQAHRDAAEAAGEHAEKAKEAKEVESQQSSAPSISAENSASADEQAAQAARDRTQANEDLAESERKVDEAESSTTSDTVSSEVDQLQSLKTELSDGIPQAINAKNEAFESEGKVVSNVVQSEIDKIGELKNAIDGVTSSVNNKNAAFKKGVDDSKTKSTSNRKKQSSESKKQNEKTDADHIQEAINTYDRLISKVDTFAKLQKQVNDGESVTGGKYNQLSEFEKDLESAKEAVKSYGDQSDELIQKQKQFDDAFEMSKKYYADQSKSVKENAKAIQNAQKQFDKISPYNQGRFSEQYADLKNYLDQLKRGEGNLDEFNEKMASFQQRTKLGAGDIFSESFGSLEDAKAKAEEIVNSYKTVQKGLSGSTTVDSSGIAQWSAVVRDAEGNVKELQFSWNEATTQMSQRAKQLPKETVGIGAAIDGVKRKVKELATYWTARLFDPYQMIAKVKEIVNVVKEYDDALTEMRKVSDESLSTLKQFQQESFGIADALGTTGKQIQNSTADWLRLGESFEEAKKSAEVSNLLLNVSEFQNIDDATQSLVSASQAYKDLDKIDIVDKLNNIGNNFSVSTDQLAKGLQNAAAVLKTQGNDIDQSLALLTAGNAITQDISKTSAGIRTISLRISGTEEAKDEIAEMGEDIDDFVVRTKSKTDSIIRDYTAVASNAYQGVSVLDDNGNLRDTYSILLDIAQVYKEIQAEDKQRGTNRAQALVETLAGKNRSNIAASILDNPELLQDVYEASQDSFGSAMVENEKYLDSMSGKLQQMKNHVEEIANIIADSDGLKFIFDTVNLILGAVTDIVNTIGGLPTIISAIVGAMLHKKGFGVFESLFGSEKNAKSGGWTSLIKGMFTKKPDASLVKQEISEPLKEVFQDIFDGVDSDVTLESLNIDSDTFGKMKEALGDIDTESVTVGQAQEILANRMASAGEAAEGAQAAFSGFSGSLVNFAKGLGSMALNMVAVTAITTVIGVAIKAIYNWATANERAIQAGKEARKNIEEITEAYQKQKEVVDGFDANRYDELYEKNKRGALSTDEYEEFVAVNNELAEIFPELISSYDEQGNAILNLGDNAETAASQLQTLLDQEQMIAQYNINEELGTAVNGMFKTIDRLQADADSQKELMKLYGDFTGEIEGANNSLAENGLFDMTVDFKDTETQKLASRAATAYKQALANAGIYMEDVIGDEKRDENGNIVYKYTITPELTDDNQEAFNAALEEYYAKLEEAGLDARANYTEANLKYQEDLREMAAEYQGMVPSLIGQMGLYDEFDQISPELQQRIRDAITNFDVTAEDVDRKSFVENPRAFVREMFLDPIWNAISDSSDEIDESKQKIFDSLISFDGDAQTNEEYKQSVNGLISQLSEDEEVQKQIRMILKFTYEDENGNEQWNVDDTTKRIYDFFGIDAKNKSTQSLMGIYDVDAMTQEQKSALDSMISAGEFKGIDQMNIYASELFPMIDKWMAKKREIENTDTLADLFGDKSYSDAAEQYQSSLSSLSGALETLRTEGTLTTEAMVELQESFPDLTEFTTESLQTKAFEELDKWIQDIQSHMEGMSEEGIKQTETYIQNLVDSYGDLGLAAQDVRQAFINGILNDNPAATTGSSVATMGSVYDAKVAQLEGALKATGQELDYHVLYTLVAQDEFSGTAQEIYEKYKDAKIQWEITVDEKKSQERIERAEKNIAYSQAQRAKKESRGQIITSDDYAIDEQELEAIRKERQNKADNLRKKMADSINDDQKAWFSKQYVTAQTEADEAENNLREMRKEKSESGANQLLRNLADNEIALTETQNRIKEAEKNGGKASDEMYAELAAHQKAQKNTNERLAEFFDALAEGTGNEAWKQEWKQKAAEYRSSAIQSDADSIESRNIPLQNEYNELQNEATELQRKLTVAEQKHQKVSKQTYRELISNGKEQINSLRKQQSEVEQYSEDWYNLQSSIDSMNDSIYDWGQSIDSLVFDQAKTLSDSLWSAMSESMSDTGLTNETIDALVTAFSDISGKEFDVSDAFYNTAEGVKVNVSALQELTEAEYDMIAANLEEEIYNIQDAKGNFDEGSTMWNLYNDQLQTLMQSQSQFFAQYQSMERALSHSNLMELAEGRENQGARYDENYERYQKYTEQYNKGLVGTDDFKEWTAYLDEWGRNTYEAYEAAKGKAERYFTEDGDVGTENFLKDLEAINLAEQDAEGYWTVKVDDMNEAAHRMGIGAEFFKDMFGKLEEYDFVTDYIGSETERQLKVSGLQGDLAQQVQIYNDMLQNGATTDELQEQLNIINGIGDRIDSINQQATNFAESELGNRKEEFLGLDERLQGLQEAYNAEGATEETKSAIADQARKDARTYGYTLNEELLKNKGQIQLSPSDLIDYKSRMPELDFDSIRENIGKQMQELGKGGSVDLLSRPMVDAAKLAEAGWEDAGEGIATVFSSTFSNADETVAMNFTPIITDENGNYKGVLSPDELQQYAEGVIDGVREDDLHLQMGTEFTGEDAIDQAVAAAEQIHNLQDSYYLGLDSFKQYYSENTEAATNYLSVLSKFDRETLEQVSLNNGNYEIDKEAEDALQGLADATGYTNENISQLLDLLGLLNVDLSQVELPEAAKTDMDRLEEFLSTTQKESGAGYNISTNVEGLTDEQLTSQLQNITQLQATLSPDSEVYQQLEQLKSDTQLQLDISAILQSGDFTVEDIRQLISSGASKEQIATAIGVDISDPAGLAKVEQVMQMAEQGYEMTVHVDDAQFRDLMEGITGEPYEATVEVNADTSEAEREADQLKRTIERKPVTQKVVQKIQKMTSQETQAKASTWVAQKQQPKQQATTTTSTANMDISGAQKNAKQLDKIMGKANAETATATADVNISPALSKIELLRQELASLSNISATPGINTSNIEHAINRTITLIQRLNEAAQKKNLALGTAHTLGTAHATGTTRVAGAKLSHAYVSGSQDWTVGQDEDALVNEIGQESRVHDGVWELLPGGPHVEHLDKDDIIYKCDFIR